MMTRKDAVLLASRAFALYSIVWGLTDVTILPQVLFDLHRSLIGSSTWTYYRIDATFYLVRIVGLFAAAVWLLKAGQGIQNFLLPETRLNVTEPTDPSPHHNAD